MTVITETQIPIRWVDLDAYNHLNNSKYYDFMTECRGHALWEFASLCNYVVIENSCKYKRQASYPCTLNVKQSIKNIGSTSFDLYYEFLDKDKGTLYAEGFAKMVCFDKNKNSPIRIPQELLQYFNQFETV